MQRANKRRRATKANLTQDSTPPVTPDVFSTIRAGLLLLDQASRYATDVDTDHWAFAVRISELTEVGLTANDIRWLAAKGYIDHKQELDGADNGTREFREGRGIAIGEPAAFTITKRGREFLAAWEPVVEFPVDGQNLPEIRNGHAGTHEQSCVDLRPQWDAVTRELTVGSVVVKQFKVPAQNQELVLSAFEEQQWPQRIDDPLPPVTNAVPQERLQTTIKSLNRRQQRKLLRFFGDGRGTGICWEGVGGWFQPW